MFFFNMIVQTPSYSSHATPTGRQVSINMAVNKGLGLPENVYGGESCVETHNQGSHQRVSLVAMAGRQRHGRPQRSEQAASGEQRAVGCRNVRVESLQLASSASQLACQAVLISLEHTPVAVHPPPPGPYTPSWNQLNRGPRPFPPLPTPFNPPAQALPSRPSRPARLPLPPLLPLPAHCVKMF
jgi:hypothetical protein